MAKAAALREKEAAACAKEKAEYAANIAALGKAIAAIESGRAGSFIQTPAVKSLVNYTAEKAVLPDTFRWELRSSSQELRLKGMHLRVARSLAF